MSFAPTAVSPQVRVAIVEPAFAVHTPPAGPKPKYDPAQLLPPLKTLWLSAEQPCCKLLKVTLPLWLEFLPELSPPIRRDLLSMSAATLERLLKPVRFAHRRRGLSTTRPGKLLLSSHPVARRAAGDFPPATSWPTPSRIAARRKIKVARIRSTSLSVSLHCKVKPGFKRHRIV